MEGLSSARSEAALGIPDLAFDDRVQDCAEGKQLGRAERSSGVAAKDASAFNSLASR
jgi:hypothetical protein